MIKLMTAVLGLALCIPVMAFAQQSQSTHHENQQMQQQDANASAATQAEGLDTMPNRTENGMVTNSGKYFQVGNTKYLVGNPHSLKKYDGQNVNATYQFDPNNNTIHIIRVKPGQ